MAEQHQFFPLQQAMFDLIEKQWAAIANSAVKTDAFPEFMQAYLQAAAHWQETLTKTGSQWLNAMNLPTREELSRSIEQVIHLEEKVEQLEDKFAQMASQDARIVYLEHELSTLRSEYAALSSSFHALSDKLAALCEVNGIVDAANKNQPASTTSKTRKSSRAKSNTASPDSAN